METRYAYVARRLAEGIASGEYPVGSILPKELDLAEHFSVSRATIRSALHDLQQLGMVSRRRNAGTRVEANESATGNGEYRGAVGSIEELVQYAEQTERVIIEITPEVADDALAACIGGKPGRRWLRISHLRVRTNGLQTPPLCWTDLYLDHAFASLGGCIPTYSGLIGTLVETRFGRRIAQVHQTIKAGGVPPHMAATLKAKADNHALVIRRAYLDATGAILLVSVSVHPADRFAYETNLLRHETRSE